MIRAFAIFILLVLSAPAWAVEVDHINGISITSHKTYDGIWSISKIKAHNGFAIASALTCTIYITQDTATTTWGVNQYNTQQYYGIIFDDGSSGSICTVEIYMLSVEGDITGRDYYAEIWSMGGSDALDTVLGRSAKIDGGAWSAEQIAFVFASPVAYDCTGANQYGITIKSILNDEADDTAGKYSVTNYANSRIDTSQNIMTGNVKFCVWDSATKALTTGYTNRMPRMRIYTQQ
jgi:hypothetical protein